MAKNAGTPQFAGNCGVLSFPPIFQEDSEMNDFFIEVQTILDTKANNISAYTYKTYQSHLRKLRLYRANVDCSELTASFVAGYIDFMRARGNSEGTIYRSLSILRWFIRVLFRHQVISNDPMRDFQLKKAKNRREFLEIEELEKLYYSFKTDSAKLNFGEQEALRAFLFSCFTGLRYSDLKRLAPRDMQNGKIRMFTQKTDAPVYIPVPKQAMELLKSTSGTVLHVVNNSTFNKNLRSGAQKLGFSRYLHAHLARHTFATSCITFGMPVEVVSKMLGHTNLRTTLIYANYSNFVIDREMEKFRINIPK